ncbi:MAG: Uma2 family endonuclease [Armatimonadetes bacterium]|nr:Uma2 family endonuclease [Armatimonadota bacterium]
MGLTLTQNLPALARHGWTVEEFERLFEAGFFAPDAKYELIEGEVWEKMTQHEPHTLAVLLAQYKLMEIFGSNFTVRVQVPLILGSGSKPEPNIAVVEGSLRQSSVPHPTTAVLIVEISDTTLIPDQQTKAALYARAGVKEYWIVNLNERTLEVRRQSAPMSEALLGYAYRSTQILLPGETVSPLAAPDVVIRVDDLLP